MTIFILSMQNRVITYQNKHFSGYLSSENSVFSVCSPYELSNHLGNVLSVVSDKPIPVQSTVTAGVVHYYKADILQAQDYSPFGVTLRGRNFTKQGAEEFRFGFQGQEMDDELKGEGNSLDFGARMQDPRLGIFLSIDPLSNQRAWMSPYNFVQNNPIMRIDPDGRLDTKFVDEEGNTIVETDDKSKDVYVIHKENESEFRTSLSTLANKNQDKVASENKKIGEKYGVILNKLITESYYKVYEDDGDFMIGYNCGYNMGLNLSTVGNCGGSLGNATDHGGGKSSYGVIVGKKDAKAGKMNVFDPKIKNNTAEYVIGEYEFSYYKMGDKVTEKRRGLIKN